jgi:hypothetical protein
MRLVLQLTENRENVNKQTGLTTNGALKSKAYQNFICTS